MQRARRPIALTVAALTTAGLAPQTATAQHVSIDLAAGMHVPFGFPENPDPAPGFHATLGFGGRPGRSSFALYFVMGVSRADFATDRELYESRGPFHLSRALTDVTAGLRALIPIVPFVPRLRLELEARGGISFLNSSLRQLDVATLGDTERAVAITASIGIQYRASRWASLSLKHEFTTYLNRNHIDYPAEVAGYTTAPSRGQNATIASLLFHF
ncbi:MAG: hypothetical protein HYY84_16885 [Deltaproteobacteria bacterium]|nr:hypothetical protein [Deltaproteobacteria bacterium]